MSLLFMLLALSGAVLVLGGGSYALRRLMAYVDARVAAPEVPAAAQEGGAEPGSQIGGYVPGPAAPDDLPPRLRTRVRNLVALGQAEEAVRVVRDRVEADEDRARRIVAELGGGGTGTGTGRALES